LCGSSLETANVLAGVFASMFNTSSNNNIPTFIHPYVTHSDTLSNVSFTEEIILNEVNNLPVNSAPGPLLARLQCPFAAYADDVKIFSSSNECRHINKLQIDLNFVIEWSDQWCLPLNPDKCSVMYLGFNNKKIYINLETEILL
jgi:hypothetical protein